MSNLRDLIRLEIERGNLPEVFKVAELRTLLDRNRGVLGDETAPESINSYLANHSTGPAQRVGEAVKRGGARLFKKHLERATYSLDYAAFEPEIEEESEADENITAEGITPAVQPNKRVPKKKSVPKAGINSVSQSQAGIKDAIAANFVDYLRDKPYRQLKTQGSRLVWGPGAITGWTDRVNAYRWNSSDWESTSRTLNGFIADLKQIESDWRSGVAIEPSVKCVYDAIKKWGNPKGRSYSGAELVGFLRPLWSSGNIVQVDSTLTKLYAFARPNAYVIYDSRVAAAIMTIAEDIYRPKTVDKRPVNTVHVFRSEYPNLGLYDGIGGTRQRGYRASSNWPQAYRVVAAQYDANDLCVRICAILNAIEEDRRSTWTLREVEAVLFMEGY